MTGQRTLARLLPNVAQLWFWLALLLVGGFAALTPVDAYDFWWHLRAGQLVATQGIPTTQIFAWTLPAEQPYVYATWLGECLFYLLYDFGGLRLPVFARNLLATLAFGVVGLEARRRSGSWRLAALALLLAGLMSSNNLSARTQSWSWLPFTLFVLLLGAYTARQVGPRALVALPLLMLFWVNAHGAFVLGLALIVLFAVGETLRRLLKHSGALRWRELRPLYVALGATLAATLLNPVGVGIFAYVARLLTDAPSQQLVMEWQPPTSESFQGRVFFASLLLLTAVWALGRRRPTLSEVLLVCAFAWLALGGMRYLVWFGMAAMPLLAQSLGLSQEQPTSARPNSRGRLINLLPLLLMAALLGLLQPWTKPLGLLPPAYNALFVTVEGVPGLFANNTPAAATEFLRANPGGRLFNEMGYGSYLIWALPEQQVFIDPRVELYSFEHWQDYSAIGEARDYQRLLARYGADRILLSRALQAELAAALARDPAWVQEYQDAQAEIWRTR